MEKKTKKSNLHKFPSQYKILGSLCTSIQNNTGTTSNKKAQFQPVGPERLKNFSSHCCCCCCLIPSPHSHTHTHLFFSGLRQLSGKKGFCSALSRWPPLNLGPGLSTREEHKGEQCCKFVTQSVKIPPGMLIWLVPAAHTHTHFDNPPTPSLKTDLVVHYHYLKPSQFAQTKSTIYIVAPICLKIPIIK